MGSSPFWRIRPTRSPVIGCTVTGLRGVSRSRRAVSLVVPDEARPLLHRASDELVYLSWIEPSLAKDDANCRLGKSIVPRHNDVVLRASLSIELDTLGLAMVFEARVADAVDDLFPRNGHAGISCLTRESLSTSK